MAEIRSSSLDVNRFHFIWKFAGFNKIPFISSHPIRSPSFSLNDKSETLWQLAMSKEIRSKTKPKQDIITFLSDGELVTIPGTKNVNLEKAVGFKMIKSDLEGQIWETVRYFVQIKIGDATIETEEKIEHGEEDYDNDSFNYIYLRDLEGAPLFDQENITIEAFIEHTQMDLRPLIPATMVKRNNFTENLTLLFKSQKYADIILKAGDCEIPAHKSILGTRTYGMEQHFLLLEDVDTDGEVQTLDLDFDDESVADAFLIFAYCGKIPKDFPVEKYPNLYAAAEKYKSEELKSLVSDLLKNYMNSPLCPNCVLENKSVSVLDILNGNTEAALGYECTH